MGADSTRFGRAPRNPEHASSDFGPRRKSPLPLESLGGLLFTKRRNSRRGYVERNSETPPPSQSIHQNHYLISFFAGREPGKRYARSGTG